MFIKLATVAAAATLVGFTAFAQDSSSSGSTSSAGSTTNAMDQAMQMDEPTANVFYSDTKARTFRPEAEWSKNWAGLNDEQRAKMKSDCASNNATARSEGDTRVCDWAGNN